MNKIPALLILSGLLMFNCASDPKAIIRKDSEDQNNVNALADTLKMSTDQSPPITYVKDNRRREDMDSLINDTLRSIQEKFELIFGPTLRKQTCLSVSYLSDSKFNSLKAIYYVPADQGMIEDYHDFRDSLRMGKFGLNSNSLTINCNDTFCVAELNFPDGWPKTLDWDPGDWGSYSFRGFLKSGLYWFIVTDHGEWNVVYDAYTGEQCYFIPVFSKDKEYFFNASHDYGYADIMILNLIIGQEISKPFYSASYEYYPYSMGCCDYEFGMKDGFWINDTDFAFCFYHLRKNEGMDTLTYDELKVRINISAP